MAPRQFDREEKIRQITRHATAVFTERGYNAATIDMVAERAGVAKGTIYQYFKSKQDLFFGVFDTYTEQYFSALRDEAPGNEVSATEQMLATTRAAFALAVDIQELFPLTFEFWAASASSEIRERFMGQFRILYAMFRKFFGEIIQRGIDSGEFWADVEVENVSAVLVGSLDGLFLQAWFDRAMDPAAAGESFLRVFLRGLQAGNPAVREAGGGHASA